MCPCVGDASLEFCDHSETRICATAQVVFADVVDSHRAQLELIGLLSRVRDTWWPRLSPEDVDAHNESIMDPQYFLELLCPVRRRMHAERALVCLKQYFGIQLVEHEREVVENAEALAWHEESTATELRRELQQARMQVSRGSGLAEQQQRQLECAPVESLPEYLGTLRTKAASDPFRVSSLAFGSSKDCWIQCGFLRVSMKSLFVVVVASGNCC